MFFNRHTEKIQTAHKKAPTRDTNPKPSWRDVTVPNTVLPSVAF